MASTEPPSKKTKTGSETEKGIKSNNENVKIIVDEINVCQAEIEKLNEKASEEILQIEQKYNKIRKPFFRQRNELFKKLPKFWGMALCQHPHVSTIIQEEEKTCLNYINDCIAEEFDDIKLGYEISFYFDENPYFENSVITKTMHLASSANARSESTPIQWKEGKNLVQKYSAKITSNGKRKRQPPATFFSWFLDNSNPSADEVAETIKEDLWPSALQYYLSPGMGDENGKFEDEDDSDVEEILDDSDVEEYDASDAEDDEGLVGEDPAIVAEVDSVAEAELEGDLSVDENYESDPDSSAEPLDENSSDTTKTDQKKSDKEVTEEGKEDVETT